MSSIFKTSYQIVPCSSVYNVFIQQALSHAHYLPPHYQLIPILICDIGPCHLKAQSLIIDSNGDLWFSNRPFQLLSSNILQSRHLFAPFQTCLGTTLWLNLKYCSHFQTFLQESSHHTLIKYGLFYYRLNYQADLIFLYPLSLQIQALSALPFNQTDAVFSTEPKPSNISIKLISY